MKLTFYVDITPYNLLFNGEINPNSPPIITMTPTSFAPDAGSKRYKIEVELSNPFIVDGTTKIISALKENNNEIA